MSGRRLAALAVLVSASVVLAFEAGSRLSNASPQRPSADTTLEVRAVLGSRDDDGSSGPKCDLEPTSDGAAAVLRSESFLGRSSECLDVSPAFRLTDHVITAQPLNLSVGVDLTAEGAALFEEAIGLSPHRRFAIVIDGWVRSSPHDGGLIRFDSLTIGPLSPDDIAALDAVW